MLFTNLNLTFDAMGSGKAHSSGWRQWLECTVQSEFLRAHHNWDAPMTPLYMQGMLKQTRDAQSAHKAMPSSQNDSSPSSSEQCMVDSNAELDAASAIMGLATDYNRHTASANHNADGNSPQAVLSADQMTSMF